MPPLWFLIPAALAAYFLFACLVGRRLRRQQPTNHPPKGGNRS